MLPHLQEIPFLSFQYLDQKEFQISAWDNYWFSTSIKKLYCCTFWTSQKENLVWMQNWWVGVKKKKKEEEYKLGAASSCNGTEPMPQPPRTRPNFPHTPRSENKRKNIFSQSGSPAKLLQQLLMFLQLKRTHTSDNSQHLCGTFFV